MSQKTLVVGATGKVGSVLVHLLAGGGHQVRAATRNNLQHSAGDSIEFAAFDYSDPAGFDAVLANVDRLFFIGPSADSQAEDLCIPFIDAAVGAGVQRFVFMTAMGVENMPERGLRKTELHLIRSVGDYTILRPNWFMQNFYPGFLWPMIREGNLYLPAADAGVSFIDTRDIAAVANAALSTDQHICREYTLTGPRALSHSEAVAILAAAAGRSINYTNISDDDMRKALSEQGWPSEQAEFMIGLFVAMREGYTAPVSDDVSAILGRPAADLEQFAQEYAGELS